MVRLSDFLGKDKDDQPPKPAKSPKAGPAGPPAVSFPDVPSAPVEPTVRDAKLEQMYDRGLTVMRTLFEQARAGQPLGLSELPQLLEGLPETRTERCEGVLMLMERNSPENYLFSHSLNVALLANHLGHCLGYAGTTLGQLRLAGLLLDIGMAGHAEEIAASPRRLTKAEWRVITAHPVMAVEQLKTAQALSREALEGISAHHERQGGGGYPGQLQEPAIAEFAKVLAVCDVYEALTHPRSHRAAHNPAHAIKTLIDGVGDQFDRRVVKVLIDELTLYPRGSLVRLNTDETGCVERIHREAPLRPVVRLSLDAEGKPLRAPKQLDLLDHPFLYVKDLVPDEKR